MEIRAGTLREVLEILDPAVPRKPTLSVLTNILLKDGQAMATDLDVAVTVSLPEAVEPLLVPHRTVLEVLHRIPAAQAVTLEAGEGKLVLSWADGRAIFDSALPEDYPPLPEMEPLAEASVDGDVLVPALLSVVGYTARDADRPILTGVAMDLGDRVTVVAADGFRLAVRELRLGFPRPEGMPQVVVIPAGAVRILGQLWKKAPGAAPVDLWADVARLVVAKRPLEIAISARFLRARFGHITMLARLVEGTFPSYRQLVPAESTFKVRAMARDLEHATRTLEGVARAGSGIVRLVWSDNTLTMSARAEETGEMELTVPVQTEGGEGRIALNVGYLLSYLKGKEGLVVMEVNTPSSPAVFHHSGSPLVVVMPMFVQWDGPAPEQAQAEASEGGSEGGEDETPAEEAPSEPAEEAETPTGEPKTKRKAHGHKKQER